MGETIQGKVVAVQGCGQVGLPLCRYLVAEGVRVVVSESSAQRAAEVGDELRHLGVELRTAPFGDNTILYVAELVFLRKTLFLTSFCSCSKMHSACLQMPGEGS